jgi:thiamine-monophosphate kinase
MDLGPEDRLHRWLRQRLRRAGKDRLGDDGAILSRGGPWTITQDQQIESVHFPTGLDPALIARRLLAVNLSDLAAMGAEPKFAFLALSCPPDFPTRRFLAALIAACERQGLELAGGDLARNDKVTCAMTLIGQLPPGGRWVNRGNARAGDVLWLGGPTGLSALGRHLLERGGRADLRRVDPPNLPALTRTEARLARAAIRRHLSPLPQLELGRWLGRRARAAAIDISDGLAIDLHRLCRESGAGALVRAGALTGPREFESLCRKIGVSSLELVLTGGEDYVLLFALAHGERPPAELGAVPIGRIEPEPELYLELDGTRHRLERSGWDHFRS